MGEEAAPQIANIGETLGIERAFMTFRHRHEGRFSGSV
jgi:hypothetical protein